MNLNQENMKILKFREFGINLSKLDTRKFVQRKNLFKNKNSLDMQQTRCWRTMVDLKNIKGCSIVCMIVQGETKNTQYDNSLFKIIFYSALSLIPNFHISLLQWLVNLTWAYIDQNFWNVNCIPILPLSSIRYKKCH